VSMCDVSIVDRDVIDCNAFNTKAECLFIKLLFD
jgi:hypothetical protein